MRRLGGQFEIVIKSPTLGLMTRVPGDQPDPRYASAASNVRFDDGVIRSAPGCSPLLTSPILDSPAYLIFQANVNPGDGGDKRTGVLVCTKQKIYALRNVAETTFPLVESQVIEFMGRIKSHEDIRNLPTAQHFIDEINLHTDWVIAVSINDNMEVWKLRLRAVTEQDDDVSFLVPHDYGASTNNNIFVRIG